MDAHFFDGKVRDMTESTITTLQRRLSACISDAGMNDKSASLAAKLGDSFVRDIMRGKTASPKAEHLGKLAVVLNTSVDYLLGLSDIRSPHMWSEKLVDALETAQRRGADADEVYRLVEAMFPNPVRQLILRILVERPELLPEVSAVAERLLDRTGTD